MNSKKIISALTSFVLTASCVAVPGISEAADVEISLMSYYTTTGASSDNGDGTYKKSGAVYGRCGSGCNMRAGTGREGSVLYGEHCDEQLAGVSDHEIV